MSPPRKRLRTALGGPRRKWAIASVIGVLVVVLGLLLNGFLSSPADSGDDSSTGSGRAPGDLPGLAATGGPASGASTGAAAGSANGPASGNDIKQLLQNKLNNPLDNLRAGGYHSVVTTARSSTPMSVVGYLVPTGTDAYGSRRKTPSFALTQKAYGTGYLAAVFVQAGQSGAPVTCSVSVDGKVTNTETTSGPYGRAVCVG